MKMLSHLRNGALLLVAYCALCPAFAAEAWQGNWDGNYSITSQMKELCDSYNRNQHAHATCEVDRPSWEKALTPAVLEAANTESPTLPVSACNGTMRDLSGTDTSETCLGSELQAGAPCRAQMASVKKIICRATLDKSSITQEGAAGNITLIINQNPSESSGFAFAGVNKIFPACKMACSAY